MENKGGKRLARNRADAARGKRAENSIMSPITVSSSVRIRKGRSMDPLAACVCFCSVWRMRAFMAFWA